MGRISPLDYVCLTADESPAATLNPTSKLDP
jgi:hypothetical protein